MLRPVALTTAGACLLLLASMGAPGLANASGKQENPAAPHITPKFRKKLSKIDKTARATKAPRASAKRELGPELRAQQFAARGAATEASASELPLRLQGLRPQLDQNAKTASAAIAPFEGRRGTGGGDVYESNSGGEPELAQPLRDLPVNVIGTIGGYEDVDFYAFTATAGETIRIEVVADRIFGSQLDSYLYLVSDDYDVLDTSDDAFGGSTDSFIDFIAPYTGVYFAGVTDREGLGDFDFEYVLSVSPSREDVEEEESNDTTSRADALIVPSTAFGRSDDNEDLDVYSFQGNAGQALIVDIDADIFLSEMDAVVELYDSQAKLLFYSDDFDGFDPRFNIVLPYTGSYYLVVYDLNDETFSTGHYYSMNISAQSAVLAPRATAYKTRSGRLSMVRGTGFDPTNGGSTVEIDGDAQPSFHVLAAPTTKLKLSPTGFLSGSDSITVVNPDGRRSNPIILR